MKYWLALLLAGLAALEFFHHASNGPVPDPLTSAEPHAQQHDQRINPLLPPFLHGHH